MAALEYLTENSLTAYPFKTRKAVSVENPNPIQDSWFLDILFVSLNTSIRSVYVAEIQKTSNTLIALKFANAETEEVINTTPVVLSWANHYRNFASAFASAETDDFFVKVVFGEGLGTLEPFTGTYTKQEAELLSAAIVLKNPALDALIVKTYNSKYAKENNLTDQPFPVRSYSFPDVPTIKPRYSTTFTATSSSSGELDVRRAIGGGLHTDCPTPGSIADLYTINGITPNASGALYLNTSSCYSANVLTANDTFLFGSLLDPYRSFDIYNSEGNVVPIDLSTHFTDHSITLQNFCKPKCPPENLSAFAHYLNRVTDGAKELVESVVSRNETRGRGTINATSKLFLASSFCDSDDDSFVRCGNDAPANIRLSCASLFRTNFHEGRTLQVMKPDGTLLEYPIKEVVNEYSVKIPADSIIPEGLPEDLSFRVLDAGVVANFNCAIQSYNKLAETFTKPYFKVTHTANEAYNPEGIQARYLSLVVAIFNPSKAAIQAQLVVDKTAWQQYGSLKVVTKSGEYITNTGVIDIGCSEYVYVKAIYNVACGIASGAIAVSVFDVTETSQQIGTTYSLPSFEALTCANAASVENIVLLEQNQQAFSKEVSLPANTTSITTYGSLPEWLLVTPDYTEGTATLTAKPGTPPTSNTTYTVSIRSYVNGQPHSTQQINIEYIARPILWSPTAIDFTLDKGTAYTAESPLLQVSALNMPPTTDIEVAGYTLTWTNKPTGVEGSIPQGLIFDSLTGKLTGQIDNSFLAGTAINLTLGAYNQAGTTASPANVVLTVYSVAALAITADELIVSADNLTNYTNTNPLIAISATPSDGVVYYVVGKTPFGFTFDTVTGKLTGRYRGSSSSVIEFSVYARNAAQLKSNTLDFSVSCSTFLSPKIASPQHGLIIPTYGEQTTTQESPLFTVIASQAFGGLDNYQTGLTDTTRNSYTAVGLPPGYQIEQYTGKVYGQIASSEFAALSVVNYSVSLKATNPIGGDMVAVVLKAVKSGAPRITNLQADEARQLTKEVEYTELSPFFQIKATNTPTSFSVTGLPQGLSCSSSGKIVGKVLKTTDAGRYSIQATAINAVGSSVPVDLFIQVPLSFISPNNDELIEITVGENYETLASIVPCGTLDDAEISITAASIPNGITLNTATDPIKLQGTPLSISNGPCVISASAAGYTSVNVTIFFTTQKGVFTISGSVFDVTGTPVSEVAITAAGGSTVTATNGTYTLQNIPQGSYNLQAHKAGYSITPTYCPIEIIDGNIDNIDFTANTGRLLSGYIRTATGKGVFGLRVIAASIETTTDSLGYYALFVPNNADTVLVPVSDVYTFAPINYSVAPGTAPLSELNFEASASSLNPGALAIQLSQVFAGNRTLQLDFKLDTEENISYYEYSVDGGATFTRFDSPIPIAVTPKDSSVAVTFNVDVDDPATEYYYSLDGGITYKLANLPKVLNITAVRSENQRLHIIFTQPLTEELITDIEYSFDQTSFITQPYYNAPFLNIPNLENGRIYNISIRAINAIGRGPLTSIQATPTFAGLEVVTPSEITTTPPDKLKNPWMSISSEKKIIYFESYASYQDVKILDVLLGFYIVNPDSSVVKGIIRPIKPYLSADEDVNILKKEQLLSYTAEELNYWVAYNFQNNVELQLIYPILTNLDINNPYIPAESYMIMEEGQPTDKSLGNICAVCGAFTFTLTVTPRNTSGYGESINAEFNLLYVLSEAPTI